MNKCCGADVGYSGKPLNEGAVLHAYGYEWSGCGVYWTAGPEENGEHDPPLQTGQW